MTLRAHVRQGDPSLSFDWHRDPPQEVRALLENLLHDTLFESVTFCQVRPVARFSCFNGMEHQGAIQAHVTASSQPLKLLLVW